MLSPLRQYGISFHLYIPIIAVKDEDCYAWAIIICHGLVEEIGAQVLEDLSSQRSTLQRSRGRVSAKLSTTLVILS